MAKGKTYYPPDLGRLVSIQVERAGRKFETMIVRAQDRLATQFTYSRPDNNDITGICCNSEGWKYDFEAEEFWDKIPEKSCTNESGEKDSSGSEVLDRPWLHEGRRRKRVKAIGNGS